ncbi:MAG TPA: glycosyltransferase family 4 protein [Thermodesulfovibrionales bacterium]|nr:glycosyltransferase family 4 protein [Thermodesulfovibrionales bacterium]
MNISYIASQTRIPSRSANSIHVMKMCSAYASLGHCVTLFIPDNDKTLGDAGEDVFDYYGVPSHFLIKRIRIPWGERTELISSAFLMPLAAKMTRPHFIHVRGIAAAWSAVRLFRLPTLFELHDSPTHTPNYFRLFKDMASLSQRCGLVVVTHALASHLRTLITSDVPIVVAPDGVDSAWLDDNEDIIDTRAKVGLNNEKRRIAVYTGHLYEGRGIELIIEIAPKLPDHLFLIVGGADSDLSRYTRVAGQVPNVKFLGFKPPRDVRLYQQAADVLLMPYEDIVRVIGNRGNSATFASPIKMFEYLAAGRPILASTLPILGEVLRHGENALLIPYRDPSGWVQSLNLLRSNLELADSIGKKAREDAAMYTWENRVRNILSLVSNFRDLRSDSSKRYC